MAPRGSRSAVRSVYPKRPRALLKYIALSTVIVLAIFIVVAGISHPDLALKIKSVFVKTPPKASQTGMPSKRIAGAIFGDAPWAMSALPECFSQQSKTTGPQGYVLAHVPAGVQMARPGSTYTAGDCVLKVRGDAIFITRGPDRLRLPPPSRLYTGPGKAALLRGEPGGLELRVYSTP